MEGLSVGTPLDCWSGWCFQEDPSKLTGSMALNKMVGAARKAWAGCFMLLWQHQNMQWWSCSRNATVYISACDRKGWTQWIRPWMIAQVPDHSGKSLEVLRDAKDTKEERLHHRNAVVTAVVDVGIEQHHTIRTETIETICFCPKMRHLPIIYKRFCVNTFKYIVI